MEALLADIKSDLTYLQKEKSSIQRKLLRLQSEKDPENIDSHIKAIAGSLHSIYTGCENILERIVRTVDGDIPLGKDYHSLLLRRAITTIDAIRPEILSIEVLKRMPNWMNCEHTDINSGIYIFIK